MSDEPRCKGEYYEDGELHFPYKWVRLYHGKVAHRYRCHGPYGSLPAEMLCGQLSMHQLWVASDERPRCKKCLAKIEAGDPGQLVGVTLGEAFASLGVESVNNSEDTCRSDQKPTTSSRS